MKRCFCGFLALMLLIGLAVPAWATEPYITIYTHGDREHKRIAITVDDWYQPELLPDFLDASGKYDCKLTLYPLGVMLNIADRPLWQRVLDEGHEIGNHSNTHANLEDLNRDRIMRQLQNMENNLYEVLGFEYKINSVRYPYGAGRYKGLRSSFSQAVAEAGYIHVVLWDVDTTDSDRIMRKVENGSIILLHGRRRDLRVLKEILPQLKEQGYEMVTVSELLGLEKTEPRPLAKDRP
ncbi:MAG: polysaccharide deacetylase family protein [Eubacteriales bacterium]|jgi:peptidoglycan/xylan/chitin deacetylase (PgdA/CDA1 family)|nr:polysaccharide deacetylase family protein [Eubacteriales bacterium]MDD4710966.1 polysaccharide deacetylase family protein [Eubacteriales bacterium]NLO15922.1 polysaccharide deacetylase family protein [Clostridiales bacterium]